MTTAASGRQARRLALALALALVAGCQTGPPPTTPLGSGALPSGGTASAAPSGAVTNPDPGPALARALRDAIDVEDILADLDRLQSIADANGGVRSAGSAGYDASAEFVAEELRRAGFEVELQPVELHSFEQLGPSRIEIAGATTAFVDIRDFKAMLYSGSGDVTARVVDLGADPLAEPGTSAGRGCDPADWAAVPAGAIVLTQPGPCRRLEVVLQAQQAGAAAVVTHYDWAPDGVLRPTLVDPSSVRIPVLGATTEVGQALVQAAAAGLDVHVVTRTLIAARTSFNVIAETPGGDDANVIMVGGHLDSVVDGPGINDNGTGTMAVLEIAREVAAMVAADPARGPVWKVRVAFWTGEEIGLLGSFAYAQRLDAGEIGRIQAYLNFDMIGSTNGVRTVYDGQATTNPFASGIVAGLFVRALEGEGLAWQPEAVGAVSDHFPLDQLGIAVGGLFSGADEHKTAPQAAVFGGVAGAAGDPCYHLACDTVANVDPVWLEQLARAAAWVVGALASGETPL
jgi:Zn-dependent M28 family amino/carboxypeptidase